MPRAALITGLAASATLGCMCAAALAGALSSPAALPEPTAIADIPAPYLAAYRASAERAHLGGNGWSYLAGIGKVESDHGRSTAAGVHTGQNAHGCCAGPMQIHNGGGSGGGTWGAYRVDGDRDGRTDVYDPEDAVATAAHYLQASGAPAGWRRALFAYNHADWYVERVVRQAATYRAAVVSPTGVTVRRTAGEWLAPLPGFPGERCDARIIADVAALARAYGVRITDCFGGHPHELAGEHPLGLATDIVPTDGDWGRTARLASDFGWSRACARAGCPGRGSFRVVLYNGFPSHGDPRHTDSPHLHLSWDHGPAAPFSAAPWVRTVLSPGAAR